MLSEMRVVESQTCVRFVERTNQIDFLEIINDESGCWSWLGRQGGRQELSMGPGCVWPGIMMHELIHALGYDHMHNDITRNNFVDILWENIWPGMEHNFEVVDPQWFSNFNTPYDLRSVMHYPRWAFGVSGRDTIIPRDRSYLNVIGETGTMSPGDFTRINRMYLCRNV
jgi:hypothetical protein